MSFADRQFSGTWVVNKLRNVIELEYKITKIDIILQYQTTCFDGKIVGLFADYVNAFLKIKQESSGWHSWCSDVTIDPDKIEKNAGLRTVAKLCFNSFWGVFGQRSNLKQTDIVKTRDALLGSRQESCNVHLRVCVKHIARKNKN